MPPKLIVIDTQSLFDWLVFRNATCANWNAVLASDEWAWIFTSPMRDEFDFVARKGFGSRWPVDLEAVAAAWDAHACQVEAPAALPVTARLHCTDPDDQKFIDLAIAARAHTLLSRDKALLRLARAASQRHGLRICTPLAWSTQDAAAAPAPDAACPE